MWIPGFTDLSVVMLASSRSVGNPVSKKKIQGGEHSEKDI